MCPPHVVAPSCYAKSPSSSATWLKLSPTVLFNERHIYEQSNDPRKDFIEGHKNIHDYSPNNAAFHCKSSGFALFFFGGGSCCCYSFPLLFANIPLVLYDYLFPLLKTLISRSRTRCACAPQIPQLLSSLAMRQGCKR